MTGARTSPPAISRPVSMSTRRLNGLAAVICGLLLVQFFIGMITNLYVTIPDSHPGAGSSDFFSAAPAALGWAVASGPAWLAFHAALGMALAAGSLALVVTTFRARDWLWGWLSFAGAMLIIGAGFNGASFLVFGHDFSSLIMAGLFALSLGCYLAGIYLTSRRAP